MSIPDATQLPVAPQALKFNPSGTAFFNGLRVQMLTFGCQMNTYDSAMVAGALTQRGAVLVDESGPEDVLIINTCSVRAHAEDRVYNRLHVLKERKRRDPNFMLVVMGCMAQKDAQQMAKQFPWVDVVVGTRMLAEIPRLLEQVRDGAPTPLVAVDQNTVVDFGDTVARRDSPFSAYLTVMRGCNKRCSFCIVPYTRGPEVSRSVAEVCTEAQRLVDDGVCEIMLLGQTIDTYGRDFKDGTTLAQLLRALHPIKGLKRLRFVTSHPKECTPELFQAMGELGDKVMPLIHMPPQSGSDKMLRRMGRGYNRQRFIEVVETARKLAPEVEFCGDWIVGFSGETDEDCEQSLSLMKEVRFQNSFIFKYSVRPGTPAQRLPDDIPEEIKKERHARLTEVQDQISLEKNNSRVGMLEDALVEGPSKNDAARLTGRTRSHRLIHFAADPALKGQVVPVRVTSATNLCLLGDYEAKK